MGEQEYYDSSRPDPGNYRVGSSGHFDATQNRQAEINALNPRPTGGGGGGGGGGCLGLPLVLVVVVVLAGSLSRALFAGVTELVTGLGMGPAAGIAVLVLALVAICFVSNKIGGALVFTLGFSIFSIGCPTQINVAANGAQTTYALLAVCIALFTAGYLLMKRGTWFRWGRAGRNGATR